MSDNFFVILMAKVEVEADSTPEDIDAMLAEFTTTRALTCQAWGVSRKQLAIIEAILGAAAMTALVPPALASAIQATSQASDSPIITLGGGQ